MNRPTAKGSGYFPSIWFEFAVGWLGFSSPLTGVTAFQPKERNEPVGDDAGLWVSQHAYTPQHFTF